MNFPSHLIFNTLSVLVQNIVIPWNSRFALNFKILSQSYYSLIRLNVRKKIVHGLTYLNKKCIRNGYKGHERYIFF